MNYIPNETEHNHSKSNVVDAVVLFKVDPITRQISKVGENDVVLVKNDHNSERYRISMPRYIDGHDMSLCDIARVHYINTGVSSGLTSSDVYESDDLSLIIEDGKTEETADEISFTWLVASTATQEYGRLAFAIELGCSSESAENGYSWHSGVYSNIEVSDGIHNSKLITSIYGDILQGWWEKISAAMGGAIEENSKEPFRFWIGTKAEYDALVSANQIIKDCVYFINDEDIDSYIAETITAKAGEYVDGRLGEIGTGTVKEYVDRHNVSKLPVNNSPTHSDYRIYAQRSVDSEETYVYASSKSPGSVDENGQEVPSYGYIPCRQEGGNIAVPTEPLYSYHAASKAYVDNKTSSAEQIGAVAKLPWEETIADSDYRLYAQRSSDGYEGFENASVYNYRSGYIPRRDTDGHIIVPDTPTSDNHAASKKYADSVAAGAKDKRFTTNSSMYAATGLYGVQYTNKDGINRYLIPMFLAGSVSLDISYSGSPEFVGSIPSGTLISGDVYILSLNSHFIPFVLRFEGNTNVIRLYQYIWLNQELVASVTGVDSIILETDGYGEYTLKFYDYHNEYCSFVDGEGYKGYTLRANFYKLGER